MKDFFQTLIGTTIVLPLIACIFGFGVCYTVFVLPQQHMINQIRQESLEWSKGYKQVVDELADLRTLEIAQIKDWVARQNAELISLEEIRQRMQIQDRKLWTPPAILLIIPFALATVVIVAVYLMSIKSNIEATTLIQHALGQLPPEMQATLLSNEIQQRPESTYGITGQKKRTALTNEVPNENDS